MTGRSNFPNPKRIYFIAVNIILCIQRDQQNKQASRKTKNKTVFFFRQHCMIYNIQVSNYDDVKKRNRTMEHINSNNYVYKLLLLFSIVKCSYQNFT